ncbi:MAG: glycine cleavage system protein GcvH [Desulfuromonadia bacterium]
MDFPEELSYSKEHLWVRVEGDRAVIGLTEYAQEQLGTIRGIELPAVDDEIEQDDSFGSVEARKTVADLYAPVSGTVVEVNEDVIENPELINDDPYDGGWLVVVRLQDHEELNLLLSSEDYQDTLVDEEE